MSMYILHGTRSLFWKREAMLIRVVPLVKQDQSRMMQVVSPLLSSQHEQLQLPGAKLGTLRAEGCQPTRERRPSASSPAQLR